MKSFHIGLFFLVFAPAWTLTVAQPGIDFTHSSGPSVSWGVGKYAVNDRLISTLRYDGPIYFAQIKWSDVVGSRVYDVGLCYYHSRSIKNFTVPSSVEEPRVTMEIRYAVANFDIVGMPAMLFLGPSFETLFHYRQDEIAASGSGVYSVRALAFISSARLSIALAASPMENVLAGLGFQVNVLSLAGRNSSSASLGTDGLTLMTIPDALRLDLVGSVSYRLVGGFVVGAEYCFDATHLADTNELSEASSTGILTLSYTF